MFQPNHFYPAYVFYSTYSLLFHCLAPYHSPSQAYPGPPALSMHKKKYKNRQIESNEAAIRHRGRGEVGNPDLGSGQ